MKWDMTKVVEEIATQAKENQEEFIFETIHPYCENILQMKINKEELKRIILRGVRPKGKWIEDAENFYKAVNEKGGGVNENTPYFVDDIACSECLSKFSVIDNETERWKYCPNCGAEMSGGGEDADSD